MGQPNETTLLVEGVETRALLDTGSTVSTLSHSFYETNFKDQPIQSLKDVLHVECADGEALPYYGYIEANITPSVTGCHNNDYRCLFLVVPDSRYNSSVPILLGTNVLNIIMEELLETKGQRFLQTASLRTPWYLAFRCMLLRDRQLERHSNRLALVRSAESKRITVMPNTTITIQGFMDKKLPYLPVCAILQPTPEAVITEDLDITPALVPYNRDAKGLIPVQISNISTRTVTISPKALLCELQPVTVETIQTTSEEHRDLRYLEDIPVGISTEDLTAEQLMKGKDLICKFDDVFSKDDLDIGHSRLVKHRIEVTDGIPFRQRHRRIPPSMIDEVRSHLQQLLAAGIIRKSHSPWTSNVVLCRKKDGKLRMCVDYRQLNQRTIKDAYALPRIEDILDSLAGNKYFTVLDMKSGYHQLEIDEDHKARTAFTVGALGFYEFNRLPFGLANAPATYQRLMEECLGDLHLTYCFIYLDDLIIFSDTYEEHLLRVEKVLQRIRESNLKLSPKKCAFFMPRVKYVGHIVSADGVEPDPDKVEKVKTWPRPSTPEEVRQFLGFIGYYRKFIKDFSKIARPLTDLMPTPRKTNGKRKLKALPPREWKWEVEQEDAFTALKDALISPPILGYPDFKKPFEVHTDASLKGLGAVLYQEQEGRKRVIAYASRGLSKSERNYPAHKLEFLALKWALCEKFHDYLYGQNFTVMTDNNPLTYILTTAKLDATGHRWVAALSSYNFNIVYRPGVSNADADGLSRLPQTISTDTVRAICGVMQPNPYVESLCLSHTTPDPDEEKDVPSMSFAKMSTTELRIIQLEDPVLSSWIPHVEAGVKPRWKDVPKAEAALYKTFGKLKMREGMLYKEVVGDDGPSYKLVIPKKLKMEVLQGLHDTMGHPARDRTISLVRDRFYWPNMYQEIEEYVSNCHRCLKRKAHTKQVAPLVNIKTTQPLELVCVDFTTLETSKGGYQHILVITDHFTKYAQAIPTKNMTAKTTADAIFNDFIIHYGMPKRIHSDQGANFEGKLIHELCQLTGIDKSRTTPYHPMGNGQCERFNRTLFDMLGTLNNKEKANWRKFVGPIVHSYNCTRHETTNQSPFFLMFGREPRLPIDLAFGVDTNQQSQSVSDYGRSLRERLREAYRIASEHTQKSQEKQKKYYDRKTRGAVIQEGDRVLVKRVAWDGKHKIANRWEDEVYIVLTQPNQDIPVYEVQQENGEGRIRTLHRNLLLPIGSLPPRITEEPSAPKPLPRKMPRRNCPPRKQPEIQNADSESEDDMVVAVNTELEAQREWSSPEPSVDETTESDQEAQDEDHDSRIGITDGQDAAESESESEANGAVESPVPARRSNRDRQPPTWQRTGEFVMSQKSIIKSEPDWLTRANFIRTLARDGTFDTASDRVADALICVITGAKQESTEENG